MTSESKPLDIAASTGTDGSGPENVQSGAAASLLTYQFPTRKRAIPSSDPFVEGFLFGSPSWGFSDGWWPTTSSETAGYAPKPCSMRPRSRSTTRNPTSLAARSSGRLPWSARFGLRSQRRLPNESHMGAGAASRKARTRSDGVLMG